MHSKLYTHTSLSLTISMPRAAGISVYTKPIIIGAKKVDVSKLGKLWKLGRL